MPPWHTFSPYVFSPRFHSFHHHMIAWVYVRFRDPWAKTEEWNPLSFQVEDSCWWLNWLDSSTQSEPVDSFSRILNPKPNSSSCHAHLLETWSIQNLSSPDKYVTAFPTADEEIIIFSKKILYKQAVLNNVLETDVLLILSYLQGKSSNVNFLLEQKHLWSTHSPYHGAA